jgi:uncharacterized membrane protein YdbT with pleckstrin-like domain
MRSAIVLVTTAAVILLDSGWWLAAVLVAGVVLFAIAHYASIAARPTGKAGPSHSRTARQVLR